MSDRDNVIRRLTEYKNWIDEITDLIGDKTSMTAIEVAKARELYTALKERLRADVKSGSTAKGRAAMTELERSSFYSVVTESEAALHAATNSHPLNSNWLSELIDIRINFTHMLGQFNP